MLFDLETFGLKNTITDFYKSSIFKFIHHFFLLFTCTRDAQKRPHKQDKYAFVYKVCKKINLFKKIENILKAILLLLLIWCSSTTCSALARHFKTDPTETVLFWDTRKHCTLRAN
jgi:hypothetical protein